MNTVRTSLMIHVIPREKRQEPKRFLPTTSTLFYLKNCSNDMNNPSKFIFNHAEVTVIRNM